MTRSASESASIWEAEFSKFVHVLELLADLLDAAERLNWFRVVAHLFSDSRLGLIRGDPKRLLRAWFRPVL